METTPNALPIISLARLADGAAEIGRLRDAMHRIGFFYLIDHGVPAELEAEILRMSRALFVLPDVDKAAIDMINSPHFFGFTRLGGEQTLGRQDQREQIDIGPDREACSDPVQPWDVLEGPNQWPAALPELRQCVERWQGQMVRIATRLLHSVASALGQDEQVFDDAFSTVPSTLLKLVHYPANITASADKQGVGAHKDPGVLTLLWVEPGIGGLEVERNGQWIGATPVAGTLIVNIGELLEWATDGYLRATLHRVTSPVHGVDRISVPFFFNPSLSARIPKLELPEPLRRDAQGIKADPRNPITDSFGANLLKSRLRAHPAVAARHHPDLVDRHIG